MFGEIYYHTYCIDKTGENARLSIRKRDYTGAAAEVEAGAAPFTKTLLNNDEDRIGGVYPTSATIRLIGTDTFGMGDLHTADDSEFQVVHLIDGQVDWIGFLVPENFSEEEDNTYRVLDLKAMDGLTKLKDIKFLNALGENYGVADDEFSKTPMFYISEALKKTGLELDILTLVDRAAASKTNATTPIQTQVVGPVIYSPDLNVPYSEGKIFVGGYVEYEMVGVDPGMEGAGKIVGKVVAIDDSEVGTGGNVGVTIDPTPQYFLNQYSFVFFTPAPVAGDVLTQATVDARMWVDPSVEIDTDKSELPYPYYHYIDGTYDTWYVLDSIARLLDLKITQQRGRWVVETLDKQYVTADYYQYDKDGAFVARQPRRAGKVFDCDSVTDLRLAGNVKFIDKTLKRVTVNYPYRYKVDGDPLRELLMNGTFFLPNKPIGGDANPATFTPMFWKREVVSNPITLNLIREDYPGGIGWNSLLFSTPTEFNSFNRLQPEDPLRVIKGDKLTLTWKQSVLNVRTLIGSVISSQRSHVTMVIHLLTKDNKNYYLVNSGDQPGWTNTVTTSPNPTGQWLREESGKVWHFLSNYSSNFGEATYEGTWSEFSEINLSLDNIPEDGAIFISFVGGSWRQGGYSNNSKSRAANSYIQEINLNIDGEVAYSPMQVDTPRFQSFYRMATHEMNPSLNQYALVKIAEVGVTKVVDYGSGRVAQYTNAGNYFESLSVEVPLGDEDNDDHLSVIKIGGQVNNLWTDISGTLGVGTIGMMLAKTLMRRYLSPSYGVDGGLISHGLQFLDLLDLYDEGSLFGIRNGDISPKDSIFNGTLEEYKLNPAPENGFDGGANSMRKGSGSSGGSGGGSSGGTAPPIIAPQSLQSVTEVGNTTTLDISVRGVQLTDFLGLPTTAPDPTDEIPGRSYVWIGDGATSEYVDAGTLSGLSDVNITSPTDGQSLVWNATTLNWENADVSGGGDGTWGSITGVLSNQTDLQNALNDKANIVHTHAAGDIVSGVLNIARIPTGTTGTTVALGNHTHPTSQIEALTGYTLGTNTAIAASDTLNTALGKLQAQINAKTSSSGTVTSVGMTVPTGLTVSGAPITTSGTLAVGLQSGYSIPTTAKQGHWDTAYGWGDHASAGYAVNGTGGTQVRTNSQLDARYMQVTKPANNITSGDITNWNAAYSESHTHANKALLDAINQHLATSSDAVFNSVHAVNEMRIPTVGPTSTGDGYIWVGAGATSGDPGAGTLAGLSDVSISSPSNGQALVWNSSTLNWENATVASGGGTWGSITGVLSNQTDLQNALNDKANIVHTHAASDIITGVLNIDRLPTGTTGSTVALGNHTHSWAQITNKPTTFTPSAHSHPTSQINALTGYTLGTNTAIAVGDTLNAALGKIQAQINAKTNNTGTVTSVAMSVPTGLAVSGSPITTTGTLALTFASGYSIPTNAKQTGWDGAVADRHTHSNKALLDTYNQSNANITEAVSLRHSHANKSVLDGITAGKVTNWDAAYSQRHTHSNKALLDVINQSLATTASVQFAQAHILDSLRIPTIAPTTLQNGNIWLGDGATAGGVDAGTLVGLSDVNITSLTNGQALVWNATTLKWENATVASGGGTWGSITGVLSNQSDLQNALNDKANIVHTHAASDIISGVLNIARIPTGTTGSTVALGNHTHTFAQITNKPTTIAGYGISNAYTKSEVNSLVSAKQDVLVSGTNIKTINGASVLGSGNIVTPNTTYTATNGITISGSNVISPVYGTTSGTIAQGNDSRINNGQTAFSWGNHALAGYAVNGAGGTQVRNNTQLDARYMQVTSPANSITTGDITNWNTAFGWGDYRLYGLGTTQVPISDLDAGKIPNSIESGFYASSTSGVGGVYPRFIALSRAGRTYGILFNNSGDVVSVQTGDGEIYTLFHSGNLRSNEDNDARYMQVTAPANAITTGDITNWNTAYSQRHTHSNKALLDVINQSLATTASVQFSGAHILDSLRIPTIAPTSLQNGNIWIGDGATAGVPDAGTLVGLSDVNIVSPTNGQSLVWNSTTLKWENATVSSGGGTWGSITGVLSNQTDLQNALNDKANIVHTHAASDIISGVLNIARIPTGTTASTVALGNDSRINNGQTAFQWGDYRQYGLGTGVTNNPPTVSDLFSRTNTDFVRYANTAANKPDANNGFLLNISRDSNYKARLAFSDNNKIFFTSGSNDETWKEFYHSGNLRSNAQNDDRYLQLTGGTVTGTITASTFSGALSGNATTATRLATARTINGTSFNGSANITTANWGTARTLTIGNTGKSVNGSSNVSWSLAEIGIPTSSDYITTNTAQTGLSGNKTTSGVWNFASSDATSINVIRSNQSSNSSIGYGVSNSVQAYAGLADSSTFAIGDGGGIGNLNTVSNRWMWVDSTGNLHTKADIYPSSGWINGQVSSYPAHSIRLGGAGRNYMDFFEYGALWNFYRSLNTGNTLVASIAGDKISSNGYEIYGRTNSDIVLAGGGHRPVSDFALVGSLGNYLPLSGGTMNSGAAIDWAGTQASLQLNGVRKLRYSGVATILSSNSTAVSGNEGVFIRPQGDNVNEGQIHINYSGQLNTANHGSSSQWKQAYDWGNHTLAGYAVNGTGSTQVRNNSQLDARYMQVTAPANAITTGNITNWNTAYSQRHTHSNKALLDVINQSLATTASVQFSGANIADSLAIPTIAPPSPQNGNIWVGDGATAGVPDAGTLVGLSDVNITSPTNGQSLVWNATTLKWENATVASGGGTWGSITGVLSNQSDLQNALNDKANIVHTHAASDIISGVLNIARIPTGTTGTTVALGNDSRINNGQTAFGWGNHALAGYALAGSLGSYVSKSGDTMTGALTIKSSTSPGKDVLLTLARGGSGYGDTQFSQSYDDRYYANGKTLDIDLHNNTYLSLAGANNTTTGKIIAHKPIEYNGVTSYNWNTAFGWGNHSGLYALVGRSIVAGNGLSGGGTLAANRTITLGTPTAIGLSTTNSVTSTSHTHALDSATTTAINNGQTAFGWGDYSQWGLGAGVINNPVVSSDLFEVTGTGFFRYAYNVLNTPDNGNGSMLTIARNTSYTSRLSISDTGNVYFTYGNDNTWRNFITELNLDTQATSLGFIKSSSLSGYVPTARTLTAGNGLSGGGNLTANRTFTLGTPSPIGLSTSNAVTTSSHTHALDAATITAINQGVTSFGWGNHATAGYAVNGTGGTQVRNNTQLDARYLQIGATSFGGNAATATTLQTARTIGLSGVTATAQSFNGSANITIPITAVPANIVTGTLSNNTTGSAATLTTSRSIAMTGDVAWSVTFNGSANVAAAGTIGNGAVTNAKMANMSANTFKGRLSTTGAPQDLTVAQMQSALNIPSAAKQSAWDGAVTLQHSHSNKSFLDTINQNMGTSNTVTFAGVIATTRLRIPTSAPSNPVDGEIWIDTSS